MNKKSVQDSSKQDCLDTSATKAAAGKDTMTYWRDRIFKGTYTRDGVKLETAHWCAKLGHGGRRETFNLDTANKETAAANAATIYRTLVKEGWDAARTVFKPKPTPEAANVGDFITAALSLCDVREASRCAYAAAFRRLVAELEGIDSKMKMDSRTGGAARWRGRVDEVRLDSITPERFKAWREEYVIKAGKSPVARRRAKTTANSLLRNARSLFAPAVVRLLPKELVLPSPLPFEGVEPLPEESSLKYVSRIDAPALMRAAESELGGDPKKLELWKGFVLTMLAGLRKGEADKLRWHSVNLSTGTLSVEPHDDFDAKSEESIGTVALDSEIVAFMRGWRALDPKGDYVMRSTVKARNVSTYRHYRCNRIFNQLRDWLREKGVKEVKAIHTMRKEAGSIIATRSGIYAASAFLRHSDTRVTEKFYASLKSSVTIGWKALTGDAPKADNVEHGEFQPQPNQTPTPKRRAAR